MSVSGREGEAPPDLHPGAAGVGGEERREETLGDKRYKTMRKGGKLAETPGRCGEEKRDCKGSKMFYFVLVMSASPEGTLCTCEIQESFV